MISEYKALPLNDSHPTSYLTNHTQSVGMHCHNSEPIPISFGVPQGSVLGPAVLFALYTTSLPTVTEKRSVLHHSYVNDSQLQKYAPPHQIPDLLLSMQKCTDDVKTWMTVNKLKLNDDKTEAMIVSSSRKSVSYTHLTLPTKVNV